MKTNWYRRISAGEVHEHIVNHTLTSRCPNHDYDEKLTVWYDWEGIHGLYTLLLLRAGLYHLYTHAILKASVSHYHSPETFFWHGKGYPAVQSLLLGSNGYFPMDDEYPYLFPDEVKGLEDALHEVLGEFVFSDEYDVCSQCYQVVRTSPDSYSWQPNYIITDEGVTHVDCIDEDDLTDYLETHKGSVIPEVLLQKIHGLSTVPIASEDGDVFEYSNGFHPGQNDDPEIITRALNQAGILVWYEYDPSQFYVDFRPLVAEPDVPRAQEILAKLNAYQGYDLATEMSKALRGEHSDHIRVTTRTITPEEFINGNWREED